MSTYIFHRILTAPRAWQTVANELMASAAAEVQPDDGALYGVWRSQIGRPRDELTAITVWHDDAGALSSADALVGALGDVVTHTRRAMTPTLRPQTAAPPERQGNYAFRSFSTPREHWPEFLDLCAGAWPGFEASYDSQVIGLWQFAPESNDAESNGPEADEVGADELGADEEIDSLLLTRRPDLAMWERSKLPANDAEAEVRRKLSRRYDLCSTTMVYTTTLISAKDKQDSARWT